MSLQDVDRRYDYKIFQDGTYLGLLPNVISQFRYTQEINSYATEIEVEVDLNLDTADEPNEPLLTEAGLPLQTEFGETIYTERSEELIGPSSSDALIANNRDVEVWEYSTDNPNGVLVFSGYISNWRSSVGNRNTTSITVISYGKDMDDYIVGNAAFNLEVSQASQNDFFRIGNSSQWVGGINTVLQSMGERLLSGLAFTISKITVPVSIGHNLLGIYPSSSTITVSFYTGSPHASPILVATGQAVVTSAYPNFVMTDFILSDQILLETGSEYFMKFQASDYANIRASSANPYANGYFTFQSVSDPPTTYHDDTAYDMEFYLYSGGIETDYTAVGEDPADMVRGGQASYSSQGGVVGYTGDSIDDTGLSLDYDFRMATFLELVEKARELAPADWYSYVDPATSILYFKQRASTADHLMILGRHLEELELEATIEAVKNVVYFTGGPTAGTNLLKRYSDQDSITTNRRGMARLNDNRVTSETVAQALSESFIEENANEIFRTTLTILATTYDIRSIKLGDTIGFAGFNSFVDRLILQITKVKPEEDRLTVNLGQLPVKQDSYVEKIKRDLNKEQTLANPDEPS